MRIQKGVSQSTNGYCAKSLNQAGYILRQFHKRPTAAHERSKADGPDERSKFHMTDSPGSNLDPAKRIELLEQRYEQLMSSINEAVYMLSPEGLLTYLSPAFETLTGWSAADWQGQSL
jgi:PAS domain-containing protein